MFGSACRGAKMAWPSVVNGRMGRIAAALSALVPMVALVLFGVRLSETEAVAAAQEHRRHWQAVVDGQAATIAVTADARARALIALMAAGYTTRGPEGLRSAYLGEPDLAMVALFDAEGQRLYPQPQELPIYAEARLMEQATAALTEARRSAEPIGWGGVVPLAAAETAAPVAACGPAGRLQMCLFFQPEALLPEASAFGLTALQDTAADQVRAPLSAPFQGMAVVADLPGAPARDWPGVVVLLLPALGATALAIWLLWLAHRAEVGAETYRRTVLAELSHELRTPLTNIRLFAALIARGDGVPGGQVRQAQIIADEAAALSTLVDTALDVALAPPGGAGPDGDPDQAIRSLVARRLPFLGLARAPHLDLGAGGGVRVDISALDKVLSNLLDNVGSYAPGTALTLRSRVVEGMFHLDLADTGPGTGTAAPVQGFGLGLATCRRIAAASNGHFIWQAGPAGCTARLYLPVRPGGEGPRCAS